jgi:hypothetical protein
MYMQCLKQTKHKEPLMGKLITALTIVFTLGLFTPSYAADTPNILVMGEDADNNTVPRDSRVFKVVLSSLQSQMHNKQFNVYDETAVTLESFTQGRVRRSDAELLDIARSITRPPIDVVVVFSIYASMQKLDYTSKIKSRITGRMLNAQTGKFLGSFEVESGNLSNAPKNCSRECLSEILASKGTVLANDLGAVLAEKLAWLVNDAPPDSAPNRKASNNMFADYYLVFDGFNAHEYMAIEEYLVIFSGYESLRPTEQRYTRTSILYRSRSSSAKLSRNLKKMLEELGMRATVNFEGNTFEMKRITLRGKDQPPQAENSW